MKNLIEELSAFVNDSGLSQQGIIPEPLVLRRFLSATMDEVRLMRAAECTKQILKRNDFDDADHFRQGLLRREVSGDIAYAGQRDHTAHMLYNFLMGWYIYKQCGGVQREIDKQFHERGIDDHFSETWTFVSLLHDVGYIFEGSISALSTDVQSRQITIGADVAHDYYHHRFWMECKLDSMADRIRLRELAGVELHDYSSKSIAGIADSLRYLGSLDTLRRAALRQRGASNPGEFDGMPVGEDFLKQEGGLPSDAFDVWERNYQYYGKPAMAERVMFLRRAFESLIWEGISGPGLRILDHGICSGLLLLQFSTHYYQFHFGLPDDLPSDVHDAEVVRKFRAREHASGVEYEALWWWSGIVWATAATALHNVQQQHRWPQSCGTIKPLGMDEDALAYLGILVDCIQEWDRYSVRRETVVGDLHLLQGIDVQLGTGNEKIIIDFGDAYRAKTVADALDIALLDWQNVLEIRPPG